MPPTKDQLDALWSSAPISPTPAAAPNTDSSSAGIQSAFDSLPDDKRTIAQQLWDGAKEGLSNTADVVGTGITNAGKGVLHAPVAVADFLEKAANSEPPTPSSGPSGSYLEAGKNAAWETGQEVLKTLTGMGKVPVEAYEKLGPNEKKALILRLGTTAMAALATGGDSLLVKTLGKESLLGKAIINNPVASQAIATTAGGAVSGEVSEVAGFEKDTPLFSKEKMKRIGSDFVESYFLPKILGMIGKGVSKTGETIKDSSLPLSSLQGAEKGTSRYFAGQLTGIKNTVARPQFEQELKDGSKTMSKVMLDEFPKTIKDADGFSSALDDAIATRVADKKAAVSDLNDALTDPKSGVKPFGRNDVGYADLSSEIRKLSKTGLSDDRIQALKGLQTKLTEGFSKPLPQGQTGRMYQPKTFDDMQSLLDETYKDLREFKAFDDSAIAKGGTTPSANAANKTAIDAYKTVVGSIKDAMIEKAKELETKGLVAAGTADKLETANAEIHELIPYQDAALDLAHKEFSASAANSPGSINQQPGSVFSKGQSLRSAAMDQVTAPITSYPVDRARVNASLNMVPDTVDNMRQSGEMLLGRKPIPNINPQGLSGPIGIGVQAAGQGLSAIANSGLAPVAINSQVQAPIPIITQLKDSLLGHTGAAFDEIAKDPLSVSMLEADPDIPPDVMATFMHSTNTTQFEKNIALGQLKMATKDKGWFPPPVMPGIHSFIETPNMEYQGKKVLGVITDPTEGTAYLNAVNEIPDITKRAEMKSAFNNPTSHYVLEIPPSLKQTVKVQKQVIPPEPKPKEVDEPAGTATIHTGSSLGNMDRVIHDY